MKIVDCFIFFNELELLELRLEMLNDKVDYFVIVECVETFSGKPKPLYYEENKHMFKKYEHKIIHYVTQDPPKDFDDLRERFTDVKTDSLTRQMSLHSLTSMNVPMGENQWLKEFYQKECMHRALESDLMNLNDEDIVFVSDLDEIWNPELDYSTIDSYSVYKLRQLFYTGFLNLRNSEPWAGTFCTRYRNLKGASLNHLDTESRAVHKFLDNGGWHFSFIGGEKKIIEKLEAYGHQEYNNEKLKSKIKENLELGKEILGRPEYHQWIDESDLPTYILDNKNKYGKFFKDKKSSPKYSIAITTYFRRFDDWFKPIVQQIKKERPDIELIVCINGEINDPFHEDYRKKVLDFLKDYPNTFPIVYPKFRSMARMWNLNIQFASEENILVTEDDITLYPGFFDEYERQLEEVIKKPQKSFIINDSFSCMSVNKLEVIETGWFDERFLGLGHEDGEFAYRYRILHNLPKNSLFPNINIKQCGNTLGNEKLKNFIHQEERLQGQRLCDQFNRYSQFNAEIKEEVYTTQNTILQYPYEKFYLDNKNRL
jgi:beta-1,4-mannosyl-glycoprotein beta-1,4-N-acetylglucosaminyltransferase